MLKAFFLSVVTAGILLSAPAVFACDPLGCLLAGHNQDILAIVTVIEEQGENAVVKVEKYFEQSGIQPSEPITLIPMPGVDHDTPLELGLTTGKQFLVSLSCPDAVGCYIHWGRFEVTGSSSTGWRLAKVTNGDDAALQWFLDDRGDDFYFIEDRAYARAASGACWEIYPEEKEVICNQEDEQYRKDQRQEYLKIGLGVVAFSACIFYAVRKNRRD